MARTERKGDASDQPGWEGRLFHGVRGVSAVAYGARRGGAVSVARGSFARKWASDGVIEITVENPIRDQTGRVSRLIVAGHSPATRPLTAHRRRFVFSSRDRLFTPHRLRAHHRPMSITILHLPCLSLRELEPTPSRWVRVAMNFQMLVIAKEPCRLWQSIWQCSVDCHARQASLAMKDQGNDSSATSTQRSGIGPALATTDILPNMRIPFLFLFGAGCLLAATDGPKLEADRWLLQADIECGNARIIERSGSSHFQVAPREDPVPIEVQKKGPISNFVVYIEVTNLDAQPREITIDVVIPPWLIQARFDYFLRKAYLLRSPDDLEYYELAPERHASLPDRMRLRIDFAAGERKIISTTPAYPYSAMRKKLEALERRSNGKARIQAIGRSAEDRPILVLEAGDKTKPRAVFVATFQSGEPSAWAILAMAEAALADPELTHFQQEYDLAFVPMTNPDGVVHGCNNVNGKGEIVLLGFSPEARGKAGNHEAKVLWKYLEAKPPVALIDFHFLALPNHTRPRPYVFIPTLYTDPRGREAGASLVRRLERLTAAPEGKPIAENHPMWQHLLSFNAVRSWNTATALYQNTGPMVSHRQAQRRGVEVMRVALDPEYMK
ncbi:MAG: hypothetical protein EXS37_19065 [Opitutus sp.]|nr:hypothetical protein [Opitutus sp.]